MTNVLTTVLQAKRSRLGVRGLMVFAAPLIATGVANAASSQSAILDSIVDLSEVSVSAIKSTSLHTFPTSSTTLGLSSIDRYNINELKNVSEIAPNFYMPRYGSRMTSSIYVRGLGARIDQPVVTMNIDNVPLLNKDAYDFNIPDLDHIEMVRGAQSILYGRNTMGGVINMSTLSPLKYTGVRGLVEYGMGNSWRANASVYLRPTEQFGLAVIGAYNATDGFFRNLYNGKKVDTERQWLGKVKAAWRPSESFVLENSAWTTVTRQGGYPYASYETGEINYNDTCFYRRTSVVDGLTMRWFGNNVSVSSITGFQYVNDNMTLDQDFLPQDYFTLTQKSHEWSFTQDFVVKGNKGSYKYLGGAFGFYRRRNMSAPVNFKNAGIESLIEANVNSNLTNGMQLIWDERNILFASDFLIPTWGWALYHKSEYSWGRFTASVGLRLAFERASIDYLSQVHTAATMYMNRGGQMMALGTRDVDIELPGSLHMTSLNLLPEVKLSYDVTDNFAIGAIFSEGHKAGGYNTQMFSDILRQAMMNSMGSQPEYDVDNIISYKPEKSYNYELNFAGKLLGGVLGVDATAFFIDCRNQQMTVFPEGTTTGRAMANAGRTHSYGVELSADYKLAQHWRFNGSYGLANARFRQYNNGIVDCKGNHVPYAPENTMFLAATYLCRLNNDFVTGFEATANCRGVGRIYWDEENTVSQPFYALAGLSFTLHTKLFDVDLWGENLTKTRYTTFYCESMSNRFVQRGNPRRFGVTLRFSK
jgi:outer membrane receptor protein involved in Fe transport